MATLDDFAKKSPDNGGGSAAAAKPPQNHIERSPPIPSNHDPDRTHYHVYEIPNGGDHPIIECWQFVDGQPVGRCQGDMAALENRGRCHHATGYMLMKGYPVKWLGRKIHEKLYRHMKKDAASILRIRSFIQAHRQMHDNSLIAWNDPLFQEQLTDRQGEMLRIIIENPGKTRNELIEKIMKRDLNSWSPRITELKQAGVVMEGENAASKTGKPRALIYPNEDMLEVP